MTYRIEQLFQDLQWINQSPVILLPYGQTNTASTFFLERPFYDHTISWQQDQLEVLQLALQKKQNYRLGHYYETLVHTLLQHQPKVHFLKHNIPVHSAGRTLGEFDLLYFDQTVNHWIHRELAVKFYLGLPSQTKQKSSSWHQWVGPNCQDRLDLKVNKMLTKQLRLSEHPAAKLELKQLTKQTGQPLQENEPIKEGMLQGYLFYPYQQYCPPPKQANPQHLTGDWVAVSKLTEYLATLTDSYKLKGQLAYIPLAKLEWLSTVHRQATNEIKGFMSDAALQQSMQQRFALAQPPQLIAACYQERHFFNEIRRFFVVADHWLDKATASSQEK
ncbi:DUF1853 family protein [Zooshikella marina]|uniref:DUF1853 family protein n=1 Tax=Zooshikella ganghwensis TaxID=202772 RepID=UPI001BB050B8|nr:DUF1853 family protein [Zooshikella ganghwensis]MBU2704395.1 DUF1853 family protein [Zooshikella ganghwensis]